MINAEIRQFKDSIIAMANACPLPIEVKRLVFSEVQTLILQASNETIAQERAQAEQERLKQEDNKDEQ